MLSTLFVWLIIFVVAGAIIGGILRDRDTSAREGLALGAAGGASIFVTIIQVVLPFAILFLIIKACSK